MEKYESPQMRRPRDLLEMAYRTKRGQNRRVSRWLFEPHGFKRRNEDLIPPENPIPGAKNMDYKRIRGPHKRTHDCKG